MSDPNAPVPDPTNPEQPQQPADTTALPQADAAGGAGAADTAALPPQGPAAPGWGDPAAGAPARYGPVVPAAAAPSGPAKWWNEATSTGGGRAALAGVAVLAALFVVAGIGLTAALVVSHHRGGDHGFITRPRDAAGMGPQQGPGMGRGNGNKNGDGNGWRQGNGEVPRPAPRQADPADPALPGNGNGNGMGMGRGAVGGLGAVLHGEFTTNITGTPTVMVVQTGQVTAYTAGKSLTVKSTDGFEATYALDGTTVTARPNAAQLANGVQVRVLAAKDGMKVTALSIG